MRVLNQAIWEDEELIGLHTSPVYDVGRCYAGAIQVTWGMSANGGELKLQASLDKVNWTDVPNTSCPVTAMADSVLWNIGEVHFPWIRIYLDSYSSVIYTARIFMKGG